MGNTTDRVGKEANPFSTHDATAAFPVASVGEEPEDGGEEDHGDDEHEVLAKVPLGPEGAEVAVVDVDEVAVLAAVVVSDAEVPHVADVAPRHEEEGEEEEEKEELRSFIILCREKGTD